MADPFATHGGSPITPARDAFAITPSDSVNFTTTAKAIYVGVAGNVVIVTKNGSDVTFLGAVAGSVLPVQAVRVNATSTTATDLVGLTD